MLSVSTRHEETSRRAEPINTRRKVEHDRGKLPTFKVDDLTNVGEFQWRFNEIAFRNFRTLLDLDINHQSIDPETSSPTIKNLFYNSIKPKSKTNITSRFVFL